MTHQKLSFDFSTDYKTWKKPSFQKHGLGRLKEFLFYTYTEQPH